jgi:hypothetical protein
MAAAYSELSPPKQKNRSGGGGGGPGTQGAGQQGRERKWDGHELEKLMDKRTKAKRECSVCATAAAAEPQGGAWTGAERRGAREKGQKRGARAALELEATRGDEVQQEVVRDGQKQRRRCYSRGADQSRGVPEEEEERGWGL